MSSVGTPSSRADPAVYSAERLQKRNPNIFPPGISFSTQTSRSESRQKSNTATLPTNIIMSNTPTLATNVVTARNVGQLVEAGEVCALFKVHQQSRENSPTVRVSKTMVTGQLQERSAWLQFTVIPARRRTSTTSTAPVSTSASRPARLLTRGERKPPNWSSSASRPLPVSRYAANMVNVNDGACASSCEISAVVLTMLSA